jgi:PKD repeat protein
MKATPWRSLAVILAGTLAAAGCGKDSTGPGGDSGTPPVANFTSSCTDMTCTFTDLSVSSTGHLTAYRWSFGDGGNASAANPSHTYGAAGQFSVTLTVTDAVGDGSVTKSVTISVPPSPGAPTANFSVTCSSLDCTFHDLSTDADGTVVGWAWSFGDGSQSSAKNPPVHHFDATSLTTYTATLTVTDNDGLTSTKSKEFTVSPAATLQCEDAPGTGHWAACDLVIDQDSRVTVTFQSASCTAHGNTFQITAPAAAVATLFTDGCYSPAPGTVFNLDNGGSPVFQAGTHISAQIISGSLKQKWPPAIHVTGSFSAGWTLFFDDGEAEAGGAPPDFNDLVLTVNATPEVSP